MSKKIVFLSGPITGVENYKNAFMAAEARLGVRGCIVLNPTALPDDLPDEAYMPICISMIEQADAIYMLNGWEGSLGAHAEWAYARRQGIQIEYEKEDERNDEG